MSLRRLSHLLPLFFVLAFFGCKGDEPTKETSASPKQGESTSDEKKEPQSPPDIFADDPLFSPELQAPSTNPEPPKTEPPKETKTATEKAILPPNQPDAEAGFAARALEKPKTGELLKLTLGLTERDILLKMVKEYKAVESYGDHGEFIIEWTDKNLESVAWPCTFAWSKPNFVRMEVSDGKLVSNGKDFFALMPQLYGQVLKIPAPNQLSIAALYPDMNLSGAMDLQIPGDLFWVPPQILLLFAKDPLKTLVPEGAKLSFDKPAWIDDVPCDRVKVEGPAQMGTRIFWIDRKTFALMRIELPIAQIPSSERQTISSLRLELADASLNPELEGETFTIEYPENATLVENFVPWPLLVQGKKMENYDSISISSFTGTNIPLSRYSENIVVLQFWSATGSGSAEAMREMYAAYEKKKDDSRLRFIGVCLDPEENVSAEKASQTLTDWQARLPSCRLPDFQIAESLRLYVAPNLVILAPGGVIARYFPPGPNSEQEILDAIQEVLDGKIDDPTLADSLKTQREEYARAIQEFIESDYYAVSSSMTPFEETAEIVPQELPKNLRFQKLAEMTELKNAGNITVISRESEGKEPLFLVPFEKNSLALFDSSGKIVNRFKPKSILSSETISLVRTALDSQGKRIYVASAPISEGGNRIHIFDDQFEQLGFYPQTQSDADSLVITDIRLADLDADKDPEIVISALELTQSEIGSGFVRVIKLDGTVLWENKKIAFPYHLGIAFSEGMPSVLVMNVASQNMTLFEFDAKGNRMREISLKDGNPIGWFVVEDLDGTGNSKICASVPHKDEKNTVHVAEIDRSGNQDWQYPFLVAAHTVPLEYMIAEDVTGDATKEWIFASADGILHFLDAKGKPIDRYAHGKIITGYNVAQIAGRKILTVSDKDSITIYDVE